MTKPGMGLRLIGILAASFAGGFASHWCLSGSGSAHAQVVLGGGVFQTRGAIKAGSLHLQDKQGKVYAEISLKEGSPVLALYSKGGKKCVSIRVDNTAGAASLHMVNTDKKSQAEIELAVSPDGAGRMKLKDPKGVRVWEAP